MKNENRDINILILPMLLLAGILILSVLRFKRGISMWPELDYIFIAFYIIWILFESLISKRDYKTEGKKTFDFGTCQIYSLGQALTIFTALWFTPYWQSHTSIHIIGIFIFIFGVIFRQWSVRTLGKYYSHKVRKIEEHKIVDAGPYGLLRHPAYLGMLIANFGIVIYFFNLITISIFLIILIPSIIARILVEEKMLFNIKGYSKFAEKRKRLIPGIW